MKLVAKIFAVLAILGLVISSFAFVPFAGAQTASAPALDRDMTIGSRGADVAVMQAMLISFGYPIPAGPTGYFGAQTRAALASYQAALGIAPAAGYFGPKTRAAFAATTPAPIPSEGDDVRDEDEDEDDDTDDERDDADDAIESAKDAIDEAQDAIDEADEEDLNDAEDFLEEAEDLLDEAEEAFDDRDYDDAEDLAGEAEDRADDARDEIDEEDDREEGDGDVSTSAEVRTIDGADNDIAEFEIEFDLEAFGEDAYIDEDASVSFEYEILDGNGNTVSGATTNIASLSSTADEDDGYYRIDENGEERFTLEVTFDPLASDEGKRFRLQLLEVNYNDSPSSPDDSWRARPESRYRTESVYVGD